LFSITAKSGKTVLVIAESAVTPTIPVGAGICFKLIIDQAQDLITSLTG
jgi:hypothetical protein